MKEKKGTSKKNPARQGEPKRGDEKSVVRPPRGHLIRIPETEARRKAIMILGDTRDVYHAFPDFQMLITHEQLETLNREEIAYELLS